MIIAITYIVYLITGTLIAVGVGLNLYRNGGVWIYDLFQHREFTDRVNKILLMGYYLVNIGYVALTVSQLGDVETTISAIEKLTLKVGQLLLILSYLHFQNIIILHWLSLRKQQIIQFFNT